MVKQKMGFKGQAGFTLIELVAVIVILGILAATAVPRFVNLQDAASQAAVNGVAGSLESASALNHAVAVAVSAGLTTALADPYYTIDDCADAKFLLQAGELPTDYVASGGAIVAGESANCTLTGLNTKTAPFVLIGTAGGTATP